MVHDFNPIRTLNSSNPFLDPNIPGRHMYEPIMFDNVQAGRLLSSGARSTGTIAVPEQTGHRHLDVGRSWSVRETQHIYKYYETI